MKSLELFCLFNLPVAWTAMQVALSAVMACDMVQLQRITTGLIAGFSGLSV